MKYQCSECGYVGEKINFMNPTIEKNEFKYTDRCPECGAGANFLSPVEQEQEAADQEVEARVEEIMDRARGRVREHKVDDGLLISDDELAQLRVQDEQDED